jgi:hypothetical protein
MSEPQLQRKLFLAILGLPLAAALFAALPSGTIPDYCPASATSRTTSRPW